MEATKKSMIALVKDLPKANVQYKAPRGKIWIDGMDTAQQVFRTIIEADAFVQQQIYALFIGANSELLCWKLVSSGDVSGTIINTRLILSIAIQTMASQVVIGHTRPHFSEAAAFGPVEDFIKAFVPLTQVLGICFRSYLILGDKDCVEAFEQITVFEPPKTVWVS